MAGKESRCRVLMFPWLGHGHVFPFLQLSMELSKRNFHIYFYSTPIILDSIRKTLIKSHFDGPDSPIELVELHLPFLPELPPHYHSPKTIPPHLEPALYEAFRMYSSSCSFPDVIARLKPDLLIYDVWQPWSARITSLRGIPSVLFVTGGATSTSFFRHLNMGRSLDAFPCRGIWLTDPEIRKLIVNGQRFLLVTRGEDEHHGQDTPFADLFALSCDIALIKSCRGIEGKCIDYLSSLCDRKIVPTGPLVIPSRNEDDEQDSEIVNWLSRKSQFSTLYVSFGSEGNLSEEEIGEIAKGLELSDVNFVWAAGSPFFALEEALPEGFFDRVKQRGIVLQKWVPQTAILAHPNVGGFMSHCGWGSVMESLYFGLAVAAVPLRYDQPVNARMIVEAGAGVEVARDENGGFDGEGVAKAINEVMVGKSGERLRSKARELGNKIKMEEEEAIDEIVGHLSRICSKTNMTGLSHCSN